MKYTLIILILLVIFDICKNKNVEKMSDMIPSQIKDIEDKVTEIYNNDISMIQYLTKVSNDLQSDIGFEINRNIEMKGTFNLLPKGMVICYYPPDLNNIIAPEGWAICDGGIIDKSETHVKYYDNNKTTNITKEFNTIVLRRVNNNIGYINLKELQCWVDGINILATNSGVLTSYYSNWNDKSVKQPYNAEHIASNLYNNSFGLDVHSLNDANCIIIRNIPLTKINSIQSIVLYNRTDCCGDRVKGCRIELYKSESETNFGTMLASTPTIDADKHVYRFDFPSISTYTPIPDLRGRFIGGYDGGNAYSHYKKIDNKGGSSSHVLTINEMPSHNHGSNTHNHKFDQVHVGYPFATTSYHFHNDVYGIFDDNHYSYTTTDGNHNHGNSGKGAAHENRPPYYTLVYIIKL